MMRAGKIIAGVEVTALRQTVDTRGAVLHMMRCDEPGFSRFGECYFSEILPKVIKAWKLHRLQTQRLAVPVGRVRLVIYDGRKASPTQGQVMELELGRPDAYERVTIPPGLWYGFACISDAPALLVNCADLPHDPTESEMTAINNSEIPYGWNGMFA